METGVECLHLLLGMLGKLRQVTIMGMYIRRNTIFKVPTYRLGSKCSKGLGFRIFYPQHHVELPMNKVSIREECPFPAKLASVGLYRGYIKVLLG